MGKPNEKVNPERQRARFTKEFKLEVVRLLELGQKPATQLALELGVARNQLYKWQAQLQKTGAPSAFRGPGRKPLAEHTELERLKRELKHVTEERDILKKAAVGSGDQRNTIWSKVELEGDRDGTHGTSGLVCCPESGTVASVETWAVVERDRAGTRQARRIDSWRGVIERWVHSYRSQAIALGADAGGTRRDFAWHGDGSFYPADRRQARASAVDRQPGNPPPWWGTHVSRL